MTTPDATPTGRDTGPTSFDPTSFDEDGAEGQGPTVRDKRRIDPMTGELRPDATTASGAAAAGAYTGTPPPVGGSSDGALQAALDERTADLQRVQAEYANYRRRMDRDRDAAREIAVANALTEFFPVLDDIGRAAEHGELVGGFKSVADRLESVMTKLGLVKFGAPGDPFDPTRHEALVHSYSDEVTGTTCTEIFAPGYQLGERILRPARVAVADPTEALPAATQATNETGADGTV